MNEQRVAIVTGANTGIGEAIADRLSRDGWALGYATRKDDDESRSVFERLQERGPVQWTLGDLSDPEVPARIARETLEAFGRVDLPRRPSASTRLALVDPPAAAGSRRAPTPRRRSRGASSTLVERSCGLVDDGRGCVRDGSAAEIEREQERAERERDRSADERVDQTRGREPAVRAGEPTTRSAETDAWFTNIALRPRAIVSARTANTTRTICQMPPPDSRRRRGGRGRCPTAIPENHLDGGAPAATVACLQTDDGRDRREERLRVARDQPGELPRPMRRPAATCAVGRERGPQARPAAGQHQPRTVPARLGSTRPRRSARL